MLEKIFGPYKDYSLLVLRIGVGGVFIVYGAIRFFSGVSGVVAPLVAAVEFFGGLAILLGTSTRLAALLLTVDMIVAMGTVTLAKGFVGGYDINLALLGGLLCLLLAGPGKTAIGGDL